LLVQQLRPDDSVAIVEYGSNGRVILNPTAGSDRDTILGAIYSLQTGGSTNLEAGLLIGYDLANQAYKPGGINRVILASDGVANVGDTGPDSLAAKIRSYAEAGIHLTTIGVGLGNYNDVMMEQLADQGDGNYAYVDTLAEAQEVFVDDLMSTLQTIGLDAKIQVEFDPQVVQQYRLIGYENRAVADNDFRNNEIRGGTSYTVDTLRALRDREPGVRWSLLLGSDAAGRLPEWREADAIPGLAEVVTFNRTGLAAPGAVSGPAIAISSTAIRARARGGLSLRYWVPDGVAEYIVSHRLYLDGAT
jgi:hypothetical protein